MSQKSSFAVTCNLLSQYIKENRALADLGAAVRQPATMSLMPGAEKKDGESGGKVRSMDLFPQQAGFGAAAPPAPAEAPAPAVTETDASNGPPRKSQLMFYGGKVLVFDNFPAEKAKDLMQMAGKSGRPAAQNFLLPPATATPATAISKQLNVPATNTTVVQGSAAKPPQPSVSYLPIARNKSLHRFMEKRKERIQARAPYETTESPGKVKKEQEENLSWLGLGPKITVKPGLSSECS